MRAFSFRMHVCAYVCTLCMLVYSKLLMRVCALFAHACKTLCEYDMYVYMCDMMCNVCTYCVECMSVCML